MQDASTPQGGMGESGSHPGAAGAAGEPRGPGPDGHQPSTSASAEIDLGAAIRRLDRLERRLGELERRLGTHEHASQPAGSPGAVPPLATPVHAGWRVASPEAGSVAGDGRRPALPVLAAIPATTTAAIPPVVAPGAHAVPPPPPVVGAPPVATGGFTTDVRPRSDGHLDPMAIERQLGGRWAAAIGGLIVLIAIGLFLRYAYEHDLFGAIPPAVRCWIAAAFGAAMLGLGELIRRRVHALASIGLWIVGIGTLYVTVYAAAVGLELIGQTTAIVLMVGVALIGVGLTLRAGSVTVGVVSIAAGYAAPFLVADAPGTALGLPTLMTVMLGIGLALSGLASLGRGPLRFEIIRIAAVTMHIVAATAWWGLVGPEIMVLLPYLLVWWALVHGESLVAVTAARAHRGTPVASFAVTAWVAIVGVLAIENSTLADGIWSSVLLVGLAASAVAATMTVGPGAEALRQPPRSPSDLFAVSAWMQAGILLVAAAAAHFDGAGLTLVWLALAALSIELARPIRSAGVTGFGWAVLALASAKIVTADAFVNPTLGTTVVAIPGFGIDVTRWTLLALTGAVAILHAAARVGHLPAEGRNVLRTFAVVAGCLLAMIAVQVAMLRNPPLASALWAVTGFALVTLGFRRQRQALRVLGLVILGLTVAKFLVVDLHGTETLWRILSTLLLGLLIVGVSIFYLALERAARSAAGGPKSETQIEG